MKILIPIFLCSSCGAFVPDAPGVNLICRSTADPTSPEACPTQEQVQAETDSFATLLTPSTGSTDFDPYEPLTVEWFEPTHVWHLEGCKDSSETPYDDCTAGGYTTPHHLVVRSWSTFVHELEHERYIRQTGYGDSDHERGVGPWNVATNNEIQHVIAAAGWKE